MFGNALRLEIELYAATMRKKNPLFTKAEDGTLSRAHVARYLANIHYLIRHTPVYLERARERALALGDTRLAEHYTHKLDEEQGHDAWAERDVERVSRTSDVVPRLDNAVAMRELVDYLGMIIDEDPALYLAYILFAEYLIVLLGPEWLALLESRCGIPHSSMTVIGNHAELDKNHVEEALDEIDELVGDPVKLPRMREVLRDSILFFDRFCAEVTATAGERVPGFKLHVVPAVA